jgi:hypothetical protein
MSKKYVVPVNFDFDGNAFIQIPEEICEEIDLKENDFMYWEIINDSLILRKTDE